MFLSFIEVILKIIFVVTSNCEARRPVTEVKFKRTRLKREIIGLYKSKSCNNLVDFSVEQILSSLPSRFLLKG